MRTIVPAESVPVRRTRKCNRRRDSLVKSQKVRHDVLFIERLEDRLLMASDLLSGLDAYGLLSTHGGVCNCPICTGQGLEAIAAPESSLPTGSFAEAPLTSLPQLHSNASATAKLFLDFNGHFEASWGSRTNVTTPVFDQDGDVTTFSAGELAAINEIWARISEDYAPFNIDVTTVDPGTQANGVAAVIAIGGNYSDWYGSAAGGVAYVGGFYNLSSNVGYVFANNLGGNAKNIAEAASHEAGHLFGLQHQASWSGSTLTESYNSGNGAWAPIMGVGYYATRTTWHNGPTSAGPTAYQDDLSILSGAYNGFGYKTDDYGGTTATAGSLPTIGTSVNFSGLIGQSSDVDMWSFTTTGGGVTFQLTGAQYGTNLDGILEIRDSGGNTVVIDSPSGSLGASLSTTLTAGTYYLVARSVGDYGNAGQYTVTGSLPAAAAVPEIAVSVDGVAVADGGTINFGTTTQGTSVTKTVTITNQGSSTLTLTSLNAGSFPSGFTLVSNLSSTSLAAGASTTFVVRLNASAAGSPSGSIQLFSDDADEGTYDVTLSGTVTAPEIAIAISGSGVADGQTVNFGSTTVGTSVSRTFTVTNTGNATLTLTSINAGSLPSGFTLLSNLGSTSLAAGQSTSFTIRLNATATGSFSGAIQLLNNDSDENPYDITLTGSVSAPEIAVAVSGVDLTSGQTVDYGTTVAGQAVNRTFTITNTGTATLTLTPLNAGSLPAGFTLLANLGSTSLAAGQSTTFSLRLDATTVGSYGTTLQLVNNDADESPFVLVLSGVVQAPEITLTLGGNNLAVGQAIDFGSTPVGTTVSRTFTVTNAGTSVLHLTTINAGGLPTGFSLASGCSTNTVNPGQSTSFTVQFDAANAGSFGGAFSLVSDDSDEGSFSLQLQAVALAPTPPQLTVLVVGEELSSGGSVNFGSTVIGWPIDRTIWIRNDGQSVLNLAALDPAALPPGYSILQGVTQTSLAAGESTCFVLRLDAQAVGSYGGQFSFGSNDAAGSFTFDLEATVVDPVAPLVQIVDNGNAGSSQSGTWQKTSGKGYQSDIQTANKGTGQAVYSWNFANLPAGQYRVYATWTTASTNASNAPYSFFDGGTKLATVAANQRLAPGASWKLLGTVSSVSGQLTVKLSNNANGKVVADAIRIERVIPVLPPAAEIDLLYNNTSLISGTSSVDFGSPDLGDPQTRTFTIMNRGAGSLTLTAIDPASMPAGFTLVENLASTYLTPGESTTFTVQLDAAAAGSFAGTISVASDDADESCFCFQVTGTVYDPAAAVTRIIDDGSQGQSKSGTWTRTTTAGSGGDQLTAAAGNGSASATWNFAGLANGEYRVQASWKPNAANASNAPYAFLNAGQLVGAVKINQRLAPNDHWDGVWFETIGTVTVTNHQLTVKLNNSANGSVVADAIRIEKIFPSGNIALPEAEPLVVQSNSVGNWMSSFLASSASVLPDGLPLPAATHSSSTIHQATWQSNPWQSALGSELPEEQLLADVLDLISEARQAQANSSPSDSLAAHELALTAVLSQLL